MGTYLHRALDKEFEALETHDSCSDMVVSKRGSRAKYTASPIDRCSRRSPFLQHDSRVLQRSLPYAYMWSTGKHVTSSYLLCCNAINEMYSSESFRPFKQDHQLELVGGKCSYSCLRRVSLMYSLPTVFSTLSFPKFKALNNMSLVQAASSSCPPQACRTAAMEDI